jgi:hypothetical protein
MMETQADVGNGSVTRPFRGDRKCQCGSALLGRASVGNSCHGLEGPWYDFVEPRYIAAYCNLSLHLSMSSPSRFISHQ